MIWGRIVGAILGFMVAGSIGVLIGLFAGAVFDHGYVAQGGLLSKKQRFVRDVYFKVTFQVMGYIAKIDGHVTQDDIKTARMMMHRMKLSDRQIVLAIQFFRQGKSSTFDFDGAMTELYAVCHHQRALLQQFVEMQFQSASASGLSQGKRRLLEVLCQRLQVAPWFHGYRDRAYRHTSRKHQRSRPRQPDFQSEPTLHDDYRLLGVKRTASDAVVKKAYRKLLSLHHPDKLVSQGVSDAAIKQANEKTRAIRRAYERIMAARGRR